MKLWGRTYCKYIHLHKQLNNLFFKHFYAIVLLAILKADMHYERSHELRIFIYLLNMYFTWNTSSHHNWNRTNLQCNFWLIFYYSCSHVFDFDVSFTYICEIFPISWNFSNSSRITINVAGSLCFISLLHFMSLCLFDCQFSSWNLKESGKRAVEFHHQPEICSNQS